jgi:branched-subunit amino acid ABC-type transport system permease component
MLIVALAVSIVGGVGSIMGTLVGALLIGTSTAFVATYMPSVSMFVPYAVMVSALLVKPSGILGRRVYLGVE